MARIRTIKPEFPQSETVGKLSRDARLLFIQLWTIVDDEGRTRAASRMLASLLYPYDDDAIDLIGAWLEELEQKECIRRYVVDGATYLEVLNWLKHQKIDRPSKSRLPAYSDALASPREDSRTLDADLVPSTKYLGPGPIPVSENSLRSGVQDDSKKYAFESGVIRLNAKDFQKWKDAYSHLDLKAELLSLTQWAETQGKNWYYAVPAALAKRNRKIGIEKSRPGPSQRHTASDPLAGII